MCIASICAIYATVFQNGKQQNLKLPVEIPKSFKIKNGSFCRMF